MGTRRNKTINFEIQDMDNSVNESMFYEHGVSLSDSLREWDWKKKKPGEENNLLNFEDAVDQFELDMFGRIATKSEYDYDLIDTLLPAMYDTFPNMFPQWVYERILLEFDYDLGRALDYIGENHGIISQKLIELGLDDPEQSISEDYESESEDLADLADSGVHLRMGKKNRMSIPGKANSPKAPPKKAQKKPPKAKKTAKKQPSPEKKERKVERNVKPSKTKRTRKKENEKKMKKFLKELDEGDEDKPINLVICGHVDSGKSTIIGHLLHLLGQVPDSVMKKYERESSKLGKGSFKYAWVLDEHQDEREHGVTIDFGVKSFKTRNGRMVVIIDTPGHSDFIPNMISGASQADYAILVIDGISFFSTFKSGQTKEHARLVRSLGISNIIVAINKMDALNWEMGKGSTYERIVTKLKGFLKGLAFKSRVFVPVSGLSGENLVERFRLPNGKMTKMSLMDAIENFDPVVEGIEKPFRMTITDVFRQVQKSGSFVAGRIHSGTVMVGDTLLIAPTYQEVKVQHIFKFNAPVQWAKVGDNVEMNLKEVEIDELVVGQVLSNLEDPVPVVKRFSAQMLVFDIKYPITAGSELSVYTQSVDDVVTLKKILYTVDPSTSEILKKKPKFLPSRSSAAVVLESEKGLCVEEYSKNKDLGRITIRRMGKTVGVGIIKKLTVTNFT